MSRTRKPGEVLPDVKSMVKEFNKKGETVKIKTVPIPNKENAKTKNKSEEAKVNHGKKEQEKVEEETIITSNIVNASNQISEEKAIKPCDIKQEIRKERTEITITKPFISQEQSNKNYSHKQKFVKEASLTVLEGIQQELQDTDETKAHSELKECEYAINELKKKLNNFYESKSEDLRNDIARDILQINGRIYRIFTTNLENTLLKNKLKDEIKQIDRSFNRKTEVEKIYDPPQNIPVQEKKEEEIKIDEEEENAREKINEINKRLEKTNNKLDHFLGSKLEEDYYILDLEITQLMVDVDCIKHFNNRNIKIMKRIMFEEINKAAKIYDEKVKNGPPTLSNMEREDICKILREIENKLEIPKKMLEEENLDPIKLKSIDDLLLKYFMSTKKINVKYDDECQKLKKEIIVKIQDLMFIFSVKSNSL